MGEMADWYLEQAFTASLVPGIEYGRDVVYEYGHEPDESSVSSGPLGHPHQPSCEGEEVIRTNGTTGVQFLGCSEFPKCRFSSNL